MSKGDKREKAPKGDLPQIPELAKDYDLVQELGRGGTAVVYLARDRELGRDVAIKLIRPSYLHDEDAIARLLREARTVGKLQHPSIVMLLGTRRLGSYGLALILQYVPGQTLKQRIEKLGQLPFDEVEHVLRDLAGALRYAHAQRIVHRDLKPENIYMDEGAELARLADFGLARAWDSDSGLTLPGTAIGTPTYMSPEQIDGKELDGRSDLYSLGLVGYEMLTGKQPWAGESLYSVIYKQKHEELPPIRTLRPDTPDNLVNAIEGAIQKSPEDRWPNAGAFLEALSEGAEVRVGPPGAPVPAVGPGTGSAESALETVQAALSAPTAEAPTAPGKPRPPSPPRRGAKSRKKPSKARRWVVAGSLASILGIGLVFGLGDGSSGSVGARMSSGFAAVGGFFSELFPSGMADVTDPEAAEVALLDSLRALGPDSLAIGEEVGPPAYAQVVGGDRQQAEPGSRLPLPLVVRVADERGLPVAGVPVEFRPVSGGGAADPSLTTTGADGMALARWTLGADEGEHVMVAEVEGVEAARFTASVGAGGEGLQPTPTLARVAGGVGQTGQPGAALPEPLTVQVVDESGTPVGDLLVRFEIEEGGGSVGPLNALTDGSGTARTTWTLGPAVGRQTVRASVEGVPGVEATFTATAAAPTIAISPTVVAGGTHSCTLRDNGTMVCWGSNASGQLGDGSSEGRIAPGPSVQGGTFARVASGMGHVCGLTPEGEALCWGSNDSGQLGNGNSAGTRVPTRTTGTPPLVAITAGVSHTCGIARDGSVYCWGANQNGELGDGTRQNRSEPTRVSSELAFRSITAGWRHTCALDGQGRAFCWGSNDAGQLGSQTGASAAPVPVAGGMQFVALSAGNAHTCGLSTNGQIACWGANQTGQLGDGTMDARSTPAPIGSTARFAAVAAGGVHTCALTTDGSAMCWGANGYGQLGDGTTQSRTLPTTVSGFNRFADIQSFGSHTCGRTPAGDVLCWGYNVDGQVGDATRENRLVPTPVTSSRP